jgi:hypothetical protein
MSHNEMFYSLSKVVENIGPARKAACYGRTHYR